MVKKVLTVLSVVLYGGLWCWQYSSVGEIEVRAKIYVAAALFTGLCGGIGSLLSGDEDGFGGKVKAAVKGVLILALIGCVMSPLFYFVADMGTHIVSSIIRFDITGMESITDPGVERCIYFCYGYIISMWFAAIMRMYGPEGDDFDGGKGDEVYMDRTPLDDVIDLFNGDR